MPDAMATRIAKLTSAGSVARTERVASVWSGYGEVVRYALEGAEHATLVAKQIVPGKGPGRSHQRKLRSYEVEQTWYQKWAERCDDTCRVARCLHVERRSDGWLFLFEDLDHAGFPRRDDDPAGPRLDACLRWLASFHATFLGQAPRGLWRVGTYWHLKTRPEEHRSMPRGRLRDAAGAIDEKLSSARHLTVVHGDAKPSNFCFARDGRQVAAVDFQYVGGGCGVKDVAYLLAGADGGTVRRALKVYFDALQKALPGAVGTAVVAEWRALYPWAWADFQRFLAGWAPHWRVQRHEEALTQKVLSHL